MNNMILNVTSNRLEIEKDTYTTGGSIDFDGCVFHFDETWEGFSKTAVFGFGSSDYTRVELKEDECRIPAICLQDEGIIKIAVYGVDSEGVVITTNAVAHRVNEGIGEVNNWYEEDNLFVYNAIRELEGSLEKYKKGLDSKFNDLLKMLRRKGSVSDADVASGEPDDWYTPAAFENADNLPSATGEEKYRAYLDCILNVLAIDFPEYVTSKQIGMDASDDLPIYAYTFEPLNYEKTIFITGGLHSSDGINAIAVSHFLNELCRNFTENRTLAYIRSKVKLVVVPVANPYGFANESKLNANGVDLERNFPYKWFDCSSEVKGLRPADQSETTALFKLIYEFYEDKFCAGLDLNSVNSDYCGKMLFYPRFKPNCLSAIAEVLARFNYEHNEEDLLNKTVLAPSINPNISNFLADMFNVNSCSILWQNGSYEAEGENESITKYAELIGNMIFALAENSSFTKRKDKLPFVKHYSWRSSGATDVYPIKKNSEKIPITSFELDVEKPCCMNLTGYAIIKADSEADINVNPVLWQENSPEQSFEERNIMKDFSLNVPLSEGIHILPIETVLQAYLTDETEASEAAYPQKVKFSLVANTDNENTASLIGYSFTLNAFESDIKKPVEISKPMGLATDYNSEDDIPTYEIVYPLENITERDALYND